MSFPAEVKSRMVSKGIAVPILIGPKPILPDSGHVIHLTEYSGMGPFRVHNTGAQPSYVRPTLQVVAHAEKAADARALAQQAYDAVVLRNEYILSTWYISIEPRQEPFPLGTDEKGRVQFAFNILVLKEPS